MAASTHGQIPEIVRGELRILIREHGTTTTLELEGEWDLVNRQASLAAVTEALARRSECLLLDLSQLSFIDSSGIHAVLETSRRCAELDTHLVLVPGPRAVQRLFELCGLTERLNFAPDGSPARKREAPQRGTSLRDLAVLSLSRPRWRRPPLQRPAPLNLITQVKRRSTMCAVGPAKPMPDR